MDPVKKMFEYGNDIGQALKQLTEIDTDPWKPSISMSTSADTAVKEAQNKQFEIEFKVDYEAYRKQVLECKNKRTKAYALLWERCTEGMKNKIEAHTDFKSKVKDNPIELLKAVKEHALKYQEHHYDMSIILDAISTLLGTKQKEKESLQDYTKRFRVSRDVL